MFITHGHVYNEDKMPNIPVGSVFIQGHTHIPRAEMKKGIYFLNPGSTTLPKKESKNSYGIYYNNTFQIKDFYGNTLKSIDIN